MTGIKDLMAASGPNGFHAMKVHGFPDIWGAQYGFRVDGHAYTFDGREFLRDILRDPHKEICCIKGAQLGVTVTALLRTLHRVCQWKWNGLYLLPVKAGTVPFTQGRIDPIINSSPSLKRQFSRVDNSNHKRTSNNNLYIRGTNVETELREIPVDFEVWDERDKMKEENLDMARTRMDGSKHKHLFMLSTPTIPDYGVDAEYKGSDQRRWFIKCPHCSNQLCLDWDTHVKIDDDRPKNSVLECDHCHTVITHQEMVQASSKGVWIPTVTDGDPDVHGYHISQLYSPTRELYELIRIWVRAQNSQDAMKELKNSALGEAFVAKGDKLTEDILDSCSDKGYMLPDINSIADVQLYFGIDVGSVLHTQASVVMPDGRRRKVLIRMLNWGDVWEMFENLEARGINFTCVIDANPERKMATDLALRFWGKVFLAYYSDIGELAVWKYPTHAGEAGKVTIDRTHAIDTSHNTYIRKQVILPANIRELGEKRRDDPFNGWYKQMMSQVRLLVPKGTANPNDVIAKYVQTGGPDHWDHSDTYEFAATTLHMPPPQEVAVQTEPKTPTDVGMPDFESQYRELVDDPFAGGGDSWISGLGEY